MKYLFNPATNEFESLTPTLRDRFALGGGVIQGEKVGGRENFAKPVSVDIQNFLKKTFPEVSFNFDEDLRYGVGRNDVSNAKYTQISKAAQEKIKDPTYELKTKQQVALESSKKAKLKADAKRVRIIGYFKDLEKYIETNAAKYSDVDKFYRDAIKKFDTKKYKDFIKDSPQTQKNVRDPKSLGKIFNLKEPRAGEGVITGEIGGKAPKGGTYSYKNLFTLKGNDASSKLRYVKDMMLINMMEKNPKMITMRDNIIKVLNNDITDLSEEDIRTTKAFQKQNLKATAARPNLLRSYFNSIIKDFESKRIKVKDVSKGVEADLQNLLKKKNISEAFRKKVRTTLNNIYKGQKYGIELRNEFTKLFGKDKPVYAPTVRKGQEFFEFEHKIGKASTGVNKLPATYMLRGSYVPSSFNYAKNINFDSKLLELMNEYKKTKSAATETKIKKLYNNFNKKSAGYLKDLTIDFDKKSGSVIVTDKTPIFKIKNYDDYKQQFAKNLKHSQAYLSTIKGGKFAYDKKAANELMKKVLPIAGKITMGLGKVIKPLGIVTGVAAVTQAANAGETNYLDLAGAYLTGDATTATTNRLLREDENFRNEYIANLPEIQGVETEVFDALQKEQNTEPVQTAELDLPEMDQTMMAAQGGRVGFQDGSPDPIFNQIIAALDNPDLIKNLENENKQTLKEQIYGEEGDRTLMQTFNTMFADPKAYPYYAQEIASGAANIPELAFRFPFAVTGLASDIFTGKSGKLKRAIETLDPKLTKAVKEKIGFTDMLEKSRAERTGPQTRTGGILELGAEIPGPATPYFLIKAFPKIAKQIKNAVGSDTAVRKVNEELEKRLTGDTVDQTRRDILLAAGAGGVVALLKYLGLDNLVKTTKVAKAAPEIISKGGTPKYFFDFVNLIKTKGDDVTEKAATIERQKVYNYKGYLLEENTTTGGIRIYKETEGGGTYSIGDGEYETVEGIIRKEEIGYSPPETIVNDKGKPVEVPDNYEEYTLKPDVDGSDGDVDAGLESIDEILELLAKEGKTYSKEELLKMGIDPSLTNVSTGAGTIPKNMIGEADPFKPKKAEGGIIAGASSGPPPKSGPTPHGLPYVAKNVRPIKERR